MLTLKMPNAAPPSGDSLCYSCGNAVVVKGFRDGDVLVYCERLYPAQRISFLVQECSAYCNKILLSKYEMEKLAWNIETQKINRQTGFIKPTRETIRVTEPDTNQE